jgi:hypothetical protein
MVDGGQLGLVKRFDGGVGGDWLFRVGARGDSPDLRAMLGGHATYNQDTFGALLLPTGHESLKGSATFSGVALSPFGIREVNLLFEMGVRLPATLTRPATSRWYRWYDATTKPAYFARVASRPKNIQPNTDVRWRCRRRSERLLLDDRWLD